MKKIKLTQGKYAIVDDEMFPLLTKFKWHTIKQNRLWYVRKKSRLKDRQYSEYMHWFIIGKPIKPYCVDHKNGNGFDNRRQNLRIVSTRQNAQNSTFYRKGRLLGAHWNRHEKRWQSSIYINGKALHLGVFKTAQEAHAKYNQGLALVERK